MAADDSIESSASKVQTGSSSPSSASLMPVRPASPRKCDQSAEAASAKSKRAQKMVHLVGGFIEIQEVGCVERTRVVFGGPFFGGKLGQLR